MTTQSGVIDETVAGAPVKAPEQDASTLTRDDLYAVLRRLTNELEFAATPSELASVLDEPENTSCSYDEWHDVLLRTSHALGLAASSATYPPLAIEHVVEEGSLLVTHIADFGWIIVGGGNGRRVDVTTIVAGRPRVSALRAPKLAAMIGLPGVRHAAQWVQVESPLPMQAVASPKGPGGKKQKLKPIKRLYKLIGMERVTMTTIVIYAVLVGLLTLLTPLGVQTFVNQIAFGILLQPLIVLTIILLVALAFAGVLRVMESYVVEVLQRRLFVRLATDLANRLPRVDVGENEKAYTPELVNRFFDVISLQKSASSLLLSFLEIALQTIIGMVVLAFYHPYLLAYDVALLVALLVVVFVFGRGALETSFHESSAKYAMAAWLEDLARHPLSFKSRRGMDLAAERANRLANVYLEARDEHWRIVLRQIIGFVTIQVVASAALLGIGGYLVIQGELTLGQLVAAELIVTTITTSVAKFGKYFETYYDAVTSVYKIGNLLDLPLEPYEGELPETNEGALAVELDTVCLSHGSGVVKSLTMLVEPGTRVGFKGEGAARSVLIDAMYGLFPPTSGAIMLDGTPIKELSSPLMRDDIALVRTVEVFDGTIDDNLRLGQELLDPAEVREALERVDLLEEFERLPNGIETRLMAHGAPLSQDQLIRLMFARAILSKPRLVLIDGALDGVRPDRLDQVIGALCGSNGWTTVVSSNREEVLKTCDRVFELTRDGLSEVKK